MIYKILVETNCYEDWQRVRDIFDNSRTTPMTQPYRFDIKMSDTWRQIKVNRDQKYLDEQEAESFFNLINS